MNQKTVITCAVTGSADTSGKSPAVPVTPKQIAQSALDAGKAGAAVVHIHVRDPETGAPSMEFELYKEVTERIRDAGASCASPGITCPSKHFRPLPMLTVIVL